MTALRQSSLFDAAEGRLRRDLGIRAAGGKHTAWLAEAREVAADIAYRTGTVTADDVRAAGVETPEGASANVWGGLFNTDQFEFVGYTHSARPEAHSNLIRVWRLSSGSPLTATARPVTATHEEAPVRGRDSSR